MSDVVRGGLDPTYVEHAKGLFVRVYMFMPFTVGTSLCGVFFVCTMFWGLGPCFVLRPTKSVFLARPWVAWKVRWTC